jgi:dsDNA-specific endonuclease/ATPase MutS2
MFKGAKRIFHDIVKRKILKSYLSDFQSDNIGTFNDNKECLEMKNQYPKSMLLANQIFEY